jgi:DnaJ-class molecular chaperone
MYKVYECPECKGKGYQIRKGIGKYRFTRLKCPKCLGTGTVRSLLFE